MTTLTEKQLERVLGRKFGAVTVSSGGNGTELIVDCPFCSRHKLSVNASKGVWQCWHCGETGTASRLLGRTVVVERAARREKPRPAVWSEPGETVPVGELPEEHEAVAYLRRRGFDPKVLSDSFGLSFCRKGRKFGGGVFDTSRTLIIPVFENGKAIAWQSRLLYDPSRVREGEEAAWGWTFDPERGKYKVPPKYFTSPGFRKGEHFFNFDQAAECGMVVVTEGAFDAMRVGRCAVAAFGKGLADAQIQILRDRWPVVVLLLDPDAADEQERLRRRIEGTGPFGGRAVSGTRCVSVRLSGYKDAGEAPHDEVVGQICRAAADEGVDLRKVCPQNPFTYRSSNDNA